MSCRQTAGGTGTLPFCGRTEVEVVKVKTAYQCNACGHQMGKWAGQCPECLQWNCLEEVLTQGGKGAGGQAFPGFSGGAADGMVKDLAAIELERQQRMASGLQELDRVLGGGIVPGSVVLIGGDPGIGKSTLLLQLTAALSEKLNCLYVSGEESLQQIGMRAERLGLRRSSIKCLSETNVERILALAEKDPLGFLVLDSIQTLFTAELQSAPGSVAQVRETAARLVRYAKSNPGPSAPAVFLVGHVTKEGALAGPRVLEHMVDAVLYFESDSGSRYRVIRGVKNRFGAVNELGVFAMTQKGLREVSNPSAIFISGSGEPRPGSAITVSREGTRPLLLEVQALTDSSQLANPRRVAVGTDPQRLAMLLAVMHRHAGIHLGDQDVFINIVGGMRISETASDVPLVLAIKSSLSARPLNPKLVSFGEVGLSGEVRPVYNGEERLKEAASHGYKKAIVAKANCPRRNVSGLEVYGVNSIAEALETAASI